MGEWRVGGNDIFSVRRRTISNKALHASECATSVFSLLLCL